jgi:hypothetical protein
MKVLWVFDAGGAIVYSLSGVLDRAIEEEGEAWQAKGCAAEVVEEEDQL